MVIKKLILVFPIAHDLQAILPTDALFIAANYNDVDETIDIYYKTNPDISKKRPRNIRVVSFGTQNTIDPTAVFIASVFAKGKFNDQIYDYHIFEELV